MSEVGVTVEQAIDLDSRRRLARGSLVLALVVAVVSSFAYFGAFRWNVEAAIFGDPSAILGGGEGAATLLRWGAFGDMFYSYLLLAPLALYLHARLRPAKPWLADIGTASAFAYIVAGGSAAAILVLADVALVFLAWVGWPVIDGSAIRRVASRP